jgi:hypothetical protein
MTADVETAIGVYCQCAAVLPVPLLEAVSMAGIDQPDEIEDIVRDVQLLAAEVERVKAKDREKRMAKK